jgi:hypothetical protein
VDEAWQTWWRSRGEEHLTLLLWAIWNPIGPVPLDEYESYAPPVARILAESEAEDRRFFREGDDDFSEAIQRQRNALYARAVERLASHLSEIRTLQIGMPADLDADRRVAETLLDWYGWEMADRN